MKRTMNLLKKSTSLVLVFAMLLGMCSTAFATGVHTHGDETKLYVSLGDSMSNGYGLTGYEKDLNNDEKIDSKDNVWGFGMEVPESYPALFAKLLGEDYYHAPLAMSAMRAEDLRFVLEFPYDDPAAQEVAEMAEWDEEAWNAMFSVGDYYTWDEIVNFRIEDCVDHRIYEIQSTADFAEFMQTAVAEADIISLGMGNADFGVFLLGRLLEALSLLGYDPEGTEYYDLETALDGCDEETRAFVLGVYDELTNMLGVTESSETLVRVLTYTVLNYVVSYAGVIERIMELNPDAEIMIVGVMNTMNGLMLDTADGSVDMGAVLGVLFNSLNTYLAALPAAYQAAGEYKDATFYYAEANNVEQIWTELSGELNDTVRDRIIDEMNDMVFNAEEGILAGFGIETDPMYVVGEEVSVQVAFEVTEIDLATVKAYETAVQTDDYTGLTVDQMFTCALYLAFEQAIAEASEMQSLDVSTFASLANGLEGAFAGVMDAVKPEKLMGDGTMNAVMNGVLAKYAAWLGTEGQDVYTVCRDAAIAEVESTAQELFTADNYNNAVKAALTVAVDELETALETAVRQYPEYAEWTIDLSSWVYEYDAVGWDALYASLTASADKDSAYTLFEDATSGVKEYISGQLTSVSDDFELPAGADADTVLGTAWDALWGTPENEESFSYLYNMAYSTYSDVMASLNGEYENTGLTGAQMLPLAQGYVNAYLDTWASEAAVETIGCPLTDAVYNALAGDDAIMGLLHVFGRLKVGNGIGVHPTANGHKTIYNAVVKAYSEKNTVDKETINRINAALNDVATIVAENYEAAYANGYQYAKDNGYIDAANGALDYAYAELAAIKALVDENSGEMTERFKAELMAEFDNALAAIAQVKTLLNEADVLDEATLNELLALLAVLEQNLDTILNLLLIAVDDLAVGVFELVYDRLTALLDYVKVELTKAVEAAVRAAIDYAVAYLRALADEAYAAFVAVVEQAYKQFGIAKEQICKYLIEKADEIIALIVAYGHNVEDKIADFLWESRDEIAALIIDLGEKYGPVVLDALLEVAAEYGPVVAEKALDYLYEHADEIKALVADLGEKYGPVVLDALLKVAAEYGPEVAEWAYNYLLENPDKVVAFVEKYGHYAVAVLGFLWENYGDEVVDFVIENRVVILTALVELLKTYGPEAWDYIKAYVGQLDLQLPEAGDVLPLLINLAELLVKYGPELIEKYDVIGKLEAAVAALRDALVGQIDAQLEIAIQRVEAAIAALKALIEDQVNLTIEKLEAAVQELKNAVVELVRTAQNKGEELVNVAVAQFVSQIKIAYHNATHAAYVVKENSYYVAIGDGSVVANSYAEILAAELGVAHKNIGVSGLNVAGSAAVLGANVADIYAADLITVGFSNNTVIDYMVDQMRATLLGNAIDEYDWSLYLNEDGVAYVEEALATIRAELTAMGLQPMELLGKKIDTVELLMIGIESYAYSYAGFLFGYPELIAGIREINADALIVSVGLNNALENVVFDLNGNEFAIGEYIQYLIDAANAETLAFAMLSGETVFVDAPAVETIAVATNSVITTSLGEFLFAIALDPDATDVFYASADGHAYIAEQIINAVLHVHTEQIVPGYAATCTEPGLTDGVICSVCGETLVAQEVIPALDHIDENEDGECDRCHEDLIVEHEHVDTDGDCICDDCGEAAHAWNVVWGAPACSPDGGFEYRMCYQCGAEEWVDLPHEPHAEAEYVERIEPTCLDNGIEAHWVCVACGSYVTEDLEDAGYPAFIDALGHTNDVEGDDDGLCDRCGLSKLVLSVETESAFAHYGDVVTYTVYLNGANTVAQGVTGGLFWLKLGIASNPDVELVEGSFKALSDSGLTIAVDEETLGVSMAGTTACKEERVALVTFQVRVIKKTLSTIRATIINNDPDACLNIGFGSDGVDLYLSSNTVACENDTPTIHSLKFDYDESGHWYVCAYERDTIDCEVKIEYTEHTMGDWTVTVEPTCTETGLETRKCECGYKEERSVDARGHNDADEDGACDICDHTALCLSVETETTNAFVGDEVTYTVYLIGADTLTGGVKGSSFWMDIPEGLTVMPESFQALTEKFVIVLDEMTMGVAMAANTGVTDAKIALVTFKCVVGKDVVDADALTVGFVKDEYTCINGEEVDYYLSDNTFEINSVDVTTHASAGKWFYDETGHWQVCDCELSSDKAEHTYTITTVDPTCTKDGSKTYTCFCGYSYSEVLEKGHVDDNEDGNCDRCDYDFDAFNDVSLSIETESTVVRAGDEITFTVYLNGANTVDGGVYGGSFWMNIPEGLTLVEGSLKATNDTGFIITVIESNMGVAMAGSEAVKGEKVALVTFTCIVNKDLTEGDTLKVTFADENETYLNAEIHDYYFVNDTFELVSSELTFTTAPAGFTVSFDVNGGKGEMESVLVTGTTYVLPECGFTAPDGMAFKAWEIDGVEYAVGTEITVTANMVIKAVWLTVPVGFTVSFDANGGKGEMASVLVTGTYTLPENTLTAPEGYKFLGWEIDGKTYKAGDEITVTADTVIKAVWYLNGDVNCDGVVNLGDVQLLFMYTRGKATLTEVGVLAGNVNGDTQVNLGDVQLLFMYTRGKASLA